MGVSVSKKGCLFNEHAVLGSSISLSYTCQSPVHLRVFPAGILQDRAFYETHPRQVVNLLETLAIKEAICYSYMSDLSFSTARGRVCQALLALAKEHTGESVFAPELTQAEIASMMALHQTTVARVIKDLRAQNIIGAFTKKKLEILSYDKLVEIGKELELPREGK